MYDLYCGWVMPRTATMISGDKSGAYRYLPASVGAFMTRAQMVKLIQDSGFGGVTAKPLSFGICVCYSAIRQ
jgi:demethylmenaquinone methyltransferase/2-methoxy-6-polyprenyl-1,4-benzoquinol methylase